MSSEKPINRKKSFTKRDAVRRSEQLMARVPMLGAELEYALGRTRWNPNLPRPSPWVSKAIHILVQKNGPFQSLGRLNKPGSQWSHEDTGIATGLIQSAAMLLEGKAPAVEADEKQSPKLTAYRIRIAAQMQELLGAEIVKKVPNEKDLLPKPQDTRQHAEFQSGLQAGMTDLFDADGVEHAESMTHNVLRHCWMFWSEVDALKSVPDLHAWLREDADIHCSIELVEKICRQIGKQFRKRGRPTK